ncbi:hypothetical protein WICPIJ_001603 [Wickerhamomyces pijperi]|uniref:Uncharacterized protein n=1 Tax=Wickerhamomyces pijperi TaxID=599730 RepID=A0A9P8TQZ8_WICPI|nr:hypothetical protein WICPIJ_001603 [Wickerhamomyces pijperi]
MIWPASRSDHNTQNNQTNNQGHLDNGKDELNFTVHSYGEGVGGNNQDNDNGNPDGLTDVGPVRDNDSGSRNFTRHNGTPNRNPTVGKT